MRDTRRYILLAGIAAAICIVRFHPFGSELDSVGTFRGAELSAQIWNPLIAGSVNEKKISVAIDSRAYSSQDTQIYMDENRNLMVPADILTEGLRCSAHLYGEEELLIEKRSDVVSMRLNETELLLNDTKRRLHSPMREEDGTFFVSLSEVSEAIGYQFTWDMEENQATAVDLSDVAAIVPVSYDLRKRGRAGAVKNQGNTGTCWAFASLAALESAMLPEEAAQLSPNHMSRNSSYIIDRYAGGEYTMALAYLLAWQGPVYEKDDPFDGEKREGIPPVKHLQEMQIMEGKDYAKIKEAVFLYGGVQTSLYSALNNGLGESAFFNREENAYCYIGTEKPNHEVVIIGWDDHFPKESFPVNVEGDGAFLCQNSWGEAFGDGGAFYVSYYDTNIGSHNVVYTKVEDTNNYDKIYQSDLCGWVGQIGFNKPSVSGANVYTAEESECLSAVGFYAVGKNTRYRISLAHNVSDTAAFDGGETIAEGTLENAGFYTIPVKKEIELAPGERYAVILSLETPEAVHPMAIEYAADAATEAVDLSDGEGYISPGSGRWERVEETFSCNLCIKAYTNVKQGG